MKKVFLLLVLTLLSMVAKANPVIPSRWDRYLGMTAAMTQVPVPTASFVFNTSEIKQMQFREISIEVGAINPSALFTKPLIFTWSILDKPFISPK